MPTTCAGGPSGSRTGSTRSSGTSAATSSWAWTRDGRPIDSLTTNPGHALWSGIADDDKARRYVERLVDPDLWTGWGLRTLAQSMSAYDPLSYHNGSVWPHDTALCIAGAARYGCWDAVDLLVDGALDATRHFEGRPPELFAGVARDDVAMPVAYPSSCSPQAWASASVLLLVRTMLGLEPTEDRSSVELVRPDLSTVPDLSIERLDFAGHPMSVHVNEGRPRGRLGPARCPRHLSSGRWLLVGAARAVRPGVSTQAEQVREATAPVAVAKALDVPVEELVSLWPGASRSWRSIPRQGRRRWCGKRPTVARVGSSLTRRQP